MESNFTPNKFAENLIMNKSDQDRYWTELIWVCRVGCLSDVVVTEKMET